MNLYLSLSNTLSYDSSLFSIQSLFQKHSSGTCTLSSLYHHFSQLTYLFLRFALEVGDASSEVLDENMALIAMTAGKSGMKNYKEKERRQRPAACL